MTYDPKLPYDPNNIFARILRGEIPCTKVYEDDSVLAFNDVHPQAPLHVLVIPKGPYVSSADFFAGAKDHDIAHFFRVVGQIAKTLEVDDSGYRLVANHGPDSRGEVPHFHVHILGKRKLGAIC